MKDDELRARFEVWISLPPFEHSFERNEESSAWPWTYRLYVTEIAWEAWQACHAAIQSENVRRDAMSSIEQIAHRWAMASYAKALGRPFEDIDSIRRELGEQIGAAIGERHG